MTLIQSFLGSPEIQQSLAQRHRYGVAGYENIYNEDGSYNFFKYDPVTGAYEPANNILSQSLFGAANSASYMKTKNKRDVDYTSKFLQDNNFNNSIKKLQAEEEKEIRAEERNQKREDLKKGKDYWEKYSKELRETGKPEDAEIANQILYALATNRDPE